MDFESPISPSRSSDWNLWRLDRTVGRGTPLAERRAWQVFDFRGRSNLQCENPLCTFRHPLRRYLRKRNEGVTLQSRWYCSLDCFEQAITEVFDGLVRLRDQPLARNNRVPLGLLLLGRGVLNEAQLKQALLQQREDAGQISPHAPATPASLADRRLGRFLIRLGLVTAQEVATALASQWGCSVFPLEGDRRYRECAHLIPRVLLEDFHMLPVHYLPESHQLFLGFSRDIDHTAVYSIERLLGTRTEPCVVSEDAMERAMDEIRAAPRPQEIVFEKHWNPPEMARTIRDYAVKLGADELRLARPRRFLWVRLLASGRSWDLMFRLPPPATP
jgi:hypothetical protein